MYLFLLPVLVLSGRRHAPHPLPALNRFFKGCTQTNLFARGGLKMPEKGGHRSNVGILQAHLLVVKNGVLLNNLITIHNSIVIHI